MSHHHQPCVATEEAAGGSGRNQRIEEEGDEDEDDQSRRARRQSELCHAAPSVHAQAHGDSCHLLPCCVHQFPSLSQSCYSALAAYIPTAT